MKTDDVNPRIAGRAETSPGQRRCDLPHHQVALSSKPVADCRFDDAIEQVIQTDSYQMHQQARQVA